MILLVRLEVLSQRNDALSQQSDLDSAEPVSVAWVL